MNKRWTLSEPDPQKTESLQQSLGIHPILCQLLVSRGIESFDQARQFFRPELSQLHSPWLMKDMQKAVDRLEKAFSAEEPILIFGDYDVDGTTSVATLFLFLKSFYNHIEFYIPHRYREGYGVSKAGIDFAARNGISLIVSVDCGIKSVELITYAKSLGIDFIVCDHHLPDKELPPAVAILNAKQIDCPYPYKELCGCGVAFKLMMALAQKRNISDDVLYANLDLVATAIAADIVPITGENRVLAFYGLKKVNENPNNGVKALAQLSGISKEMHIHNLVFMIAPRVNAAGRMDDARKAVEMFVAENYEQALHFAEELHSDNTDRKEADSSITEAALAMIESDEILIKRKTTVLYNENWHKGVVGIVASRLIERYHRPTVVLTRSGDIAAGSARSVPGFNLYEAIHACRGHLLGYGGHFAAAGMTLSLDQLENFSQAFEQIVTETIPEQLLIPEITVDAEISIGQIQPKFYQILQQMEPFGPGNMRPQFLVCKAYDTGYSKIVKEQHLRIVLSQNNCSITGIGFGMADKYPLLQKGPIDIVFTIDENEWQGQTSLQMRIIDIRQSEQA